MTNKQTLEALRLAEELNLGNHEFSTDASRLLKTQAQDIQLLEKSESDLIGERDHLEEIVNRVADAVLGVDRHEWSSYYDLEDAAQEIEDKMLEQHAEMEQLRAEVEALRKSKFRGPTKFAPEEKADGNRGIRWICEDGVYGRPTDHDVREYLLRTETARGCSCEECKSFYPAMQSTKEQP